MAQASKRRSSRQMASRKRSRYAEPDTDDDLVEQTDFDSDQEPPRELTGASRPSKRQRITKHRPKTRSKTTPSKSSPAKRKKKQKKRQTFVVGQPRRARTTLKEDELLPGKFTGPSDGLIPPWTRLPQNILRDIFLFGSQPLTAENATWLVGAARTCRAFMEPALEALYHWPAIWSPLHLHRLLELLKKKEGRLINHNVKIRRLDIDVRRLAYTAHNRPLFDLSELIPEMPRLQHMEIVHPIDEPPYREVKVQNWYYSDSFLHTLGSSHIRLKAWRWTKDMLKNRTSTVMYETMTSVHQSPAFADLRELVLCGFSLDDTGRPWLPLEVGEDVEGRAANLCKAISQLKNLKDITFISCNIVRERFLTTLPLGIERLELSNCHEVNSEVLAHYLNESGSSLKELVLNHNPALDLAFLPGLKVNCPRLETLEMDMHFYSEYIATNDAEPLYDELLQADEVPTWPKTMTHIDLVHMQKWDSRGAINLFRSLIDSAPELPDLRFIVLHSHINIPWRDRAGFRDNWTERVFKVFKRRLRAPDPHNNSKRQYEIWKANNSTQKNGIDKHEVKEIEPRLEENLGEEVANTNAASIEPRPQRRSQRVIAKPVRALSSASPSPDEAESSSEDSQTIDDGNELFIQGLCDVVDIRVDNQRPRENQFTEQDFLDTEASGDEDWNENADDDVDEGYAW